MKGSYERPYQEEKHVSRSRNKLQKIQHPSDHVQVKQSGNPESRPLPTSVDVVVFALSPRQAHSMWAPIKESLVIVQQGNRLGSPSLSSTSLQTVSLIPFSPPQSLITTTPVLSTRACPDLPKESWPTGH